MKPTKLMNQLHKRIRAFTLIELAVVLGVLALLGAMVLPAMARARGTSSRVACADNLKQIGVAFNTWKVSHSGAYPMYIPNGRGGPPGLNAGQTIAASAAAYGGAVYGPASVEYAVFGVMSNELSTPKILVCPSDERIAHSNFTMHVAGVVPNQAAQPSTPNTLNDLDPAYFNNFKLSYFLGVFAVDANPQMFLSGDRNIWGDHNGTQPPWGANGYGNINGNQYWMGSTNLPAGATFPQWTPTKMHQSRGNVLLTDGSVQQLDSAHLRNQLANSGDTSSPSSGYSGPNTLLFP
jgi:prepilin-type processing-associated H-X9-DG protein